MNLSQSDIDRLWSKIDQSGQCWIWTGGVNQKGYGQIWMNQTMMKAHRVVFEIVNGKPITGLRITHDCGNRLCCNPTHLSVMGELTEGRDAIMEWFEKPVVNRRFWEQVEKNKETGCWEWIGNTLPRGYGQFSAQGRRQYAHRLSFTIHHGDIPYGHFICHICDNPACVNPEHLWSGTHSDNMADMKKKGRQSKGPGLTGEDHPLAKLTDEKVRRHQALVRHRRGSFPSYGKRVRSIRPGYCRRSEAQDMEAHKIAILLLEHELQHKESE